MSTYTISRDEMLKLLKARAAIVEDFINSFFAKQINIPQQLKNSMLYSLNAGGKRLRPVLCMTFANLFGEQTENVLPFCAAIEMVHTYSLIHDDLPAMDNDDLRRGKPTNHKAFDEATAILAGDGLLTDAFELISSMELPAKLILKALNTFAQAAGSAGMVGGQMLDMIYTGQKNISLQHTRTMQEMKTGAIIKASCVCGAILAFANEDEINRVAIFGDSAGRAFQIVDDMLDIIGNVDDLGKNTGMDQERGKITLPSLLGLEKSGEIARQEIEKAKGAIAAFEGDNAAFLRAIADYIIDRIV